MNIYRPPRTLSAEGGFYGKCAEAYLAEDDLSAEMVEDMVKEVRVFNPEQIEVELNYTDLV